jgi:hypothetical protein
MKLRQGPIDYRDCYVRLMLDLKLVNFCWVHETNSVSITLFLHLLFLQATKNEYEVNK